MNHFVKRIMQRQSSTVSTAKPVLSNHIASVPLQYAKRETDFIRPVINSLKGLNGEESLERNETKIVESQSSKKSRTINNDLEKDYNQIKTDISQDIAVSSPKHKNENSKDKSIEDSVIEINEEKDVDNYNDSIEKKSELISDLKSLHERDNGINYRSNSQFNELTSKTEDIESQEFDQKTDEVDNKSIKSSNKERKEDIRKNDIKNDFKSNPKIRSANDSNEKYRENRKPLIHDENIVEKNSEAGISVTKPHDTPSKTKKINNREKDYLESDITTVEEKKIDNTFNNKKESVTQNPKRESVEQKQLNDFSNLSLNSLVMQAKEAMDTSIAFSGIEALKSKASEVAKIKKAIFETKIKEDQDKVNKNRDDSKKSVKESEKSKPSYSQEQAFLQTKMNQTIQKINESNREKRETIKINIGRIEIKGVETAPVQKVNKEPVPAGSGHISLNDYLKDRNMGKR